MYLLLALACLLFQNMYARHQLTQHLHIYSFLINRKGWRLDLKGTKRVLSPQSRSGKWTLNFNVILCANLTPPFRSEVHFQRKGATNFVAIMLEWKLLFRAFQTVFCYNTLTLHSLNIFSYGRVDQAPLEEIEYGIRPTPQIFSMWVGGWTVLCSFLALIWEWVEQRLHCHFLSPLGTIIPQSGYF